MGETVVIKKSRNNQKYISKGERGTYNSENKLNELTGKEWIKFTKSWFIHYPPRSEDKKILHPASFPETLIQEFIEFFTKKGQSGNLKDEQFIPDILAVKQVKINWGRVCRIIRSGLV